MILSFKTKINGKPSLFIEKIWEGFFRNDFFDGKDTEFINCYELHKEKFGETWDELPAEERLEFPKIHTIRKDEKNRWKTGVMIDFFINTRQKNMFRFAPRVPVVSVQMIGIYHLEKSIEVCVDGTYLFPFEIEELAINDGFENVEEFFEYFNETFHGKIIHWTNFKY